MASDQIIVTGVAWAVIGIVVAFAARLSGRPFLPWLLYSFAFWPLALIHLLFWKPRVPDSAPLDDEPGA